MGNNIILVSLIILFLAYFIFIFINQKQTSKESFNLKYIEEPTNHKIVNVINTMLKDVHSLFKRFGIRYWIDKNTLLGAVQYRGVIPFDLNSNICVLLQDKPRLIDLTYILEEMGYGLLKSREKYKLYPLNGIDAEYYEKYWNLTDIDNELLDYKIPYMDIEFCYVDQSNQDRILYFNKLKSDMHWKTTNVFPLKKYVFNDFEMFGPNNPTPYLDRLYRND